MSLQALIFDVDGTLADTEELHRKAFNAAFAAHDLAWEWDPALYRELLAVAGGKERIAHYIESLGLPGTESERLARIAPSIHAEKTRLFARLIDSGNLRPQPGVARLIAEAQTAGLQLAIASTTSPANVEALIPKLLGAGALSRFSVIATGDVVARKKPYPDIYRLTIERLGVSAEDCVAFEDSDLGVRAAKAAGLFTIAVPTWWTETQDLSAADLLLPSLGDPGHPLASSSAVEIGGIWLGVSQLSLLHGNRAKRLESQRVAS